VPQKPQDFNQNAYRRIPNEPGKSVSAKDLPLTPTQQRLKDKLMRQFCKATADGPLGNSEAYQRGWERIFGNKNAKEDDQQN